MLKRALAAVFLSAMATSAWADHGDFHCSGIPFATGPDKEAVDQLAHNNGMRKILFFLAVQWENEEMRRLCDAAANGEGIDTSCFDGRRDWTAIASRIPDGLEGKSNKELRPVMLKLQSQEHHTTKRAEALRHCANLGVVDSSFK